MKELLLSDNSLLILKKRYLKKDENGEVIETPSEMFSRVSRVISSVEKKYEQGDNPEELYERFYNMMVDFYFVPNSPTLMNAGAAFGQLSACFVLPVEDSMLDIFEAVKRTAIIHQTGGGTGFSFSRLRPKNDIVKSTGGVASGPVSFMKVFNEATEAVKQGGRRRGANMGILRVDHPDILEFIESKTKERELSNFNISVAITDRFMQALEKEEEYELINPRTGKIQSRLSSTEVFNKLVSSAWKNGEPGVIFIDTINKKHPIPGAGDIESTNPCGEQPLLPYESCNLGSINLSKFIKGKQFLVEHKRKATFDEAISRIDFEKLEEIVRLSVHFLDNVIDANNFPFDEISNMTRANRKVGLGIMGFADMLIKIGVPYSSEEALKIAEKVMSFIQEKGVAESMELGEKKGDFPNIGKSVYKHHMRNGTITTIAPTGTISMIAETSSGIEPLFSIAYTKHVLGGESLVYVNKNFEEVARGLGFYSSSLMEKVADARSIKKFRDIPDFVRDIFETTFDISPMQHVRMQAAFQKYVDNAVSKTINLPNEAQIKDVEKVYREAYTLGLKGITVYRDGSRQEQVLNVGKKGSKKLGVLTPRARPQVTKGRTYRLATEMGTLYVTINEDNEGLLEMFVQLGKSGSSVMAFTEAIGRLISLALRSGVNPREVIKQLRGIKSSSPTRQEDGDMVFSVPDAIAKCLDRYLAGGEQLELIPAQKEKGLGGIPLFLNNEKSKDENAVREVDICPECGGALIYQEGCYVCRDCGYSKCE